MYDTYDPYANQDNPGLTQQQAEQLAQAIYELNDQVQYYYQAKLQEMNNILEILQDLQKLTSEQQLRQVQSTLNYHALEKEPMIYLPEDQLEESLPEGQMKRRVSVQAKYYQKSLKRKVKTTIPAKYYEKTIPVVRPNPAPGMPITAGDSVFASLKSSQPFLTAKLESMLPAFTQETQVVALKKSAPILSAEFESTITALTKQIQMAQPLLAIELENALEQTIQNQAIFAAELSQLLVDAKLMVGCYLGELGVTDVMDGCDKMM